MAGAKCQSFQRHLWRLWHLPRGSSVGPGGRWAIEKAEEAQEAQWDYGKRLFSKSAFLSLLRSVETFEECLFNGLAF